jgi:membrane protein YqaA with SNARE-associated domain
MDWSVLNQGPPALWGLFVSAFISSTLAPGGSEALLAYLVDQATHDPAALVGAATVGNTLGAMTTWLLGYWTGLKFPADSPMDPGCHRAVLAVRRWGASLLLLSWLPVVGDGFCFAAGWLKMPFWKSLAAMALGKLARYSVIAAALAA